MQSRYRLRSGEIATHERGQYRCSKRQNDSFHHVSNRGRCRNTSIATTLLDHTVVDLIRDCMLDPDKLATCIDAGSGNATPPPDLRRIASEIDALNEKRRRIYDAYAKEHITPEAYIQTSRAIDEGIVALRGQRDALLTAWRQASSAETLAASLRQFCATARARFEACVDFDAKRAFLSDYVESVTFDHGKVILGSLPHEGAAQGKVPFNIAGRIAKGSKRRWPQDERFGSWVPNQCLGRVLS